jgi:hypothetical protein
MHYTQSSQFAQRFLNVADDWLDRAAAIGNRLSGHANNLLRWVAVFIPDNYTFHGRRLRQNAERIMNDLEQAINDGFEGELNLDREDLLYNLQRMRDQIPEIYFVDYED